MSTNQDALRQLAKTASAADAAQMLATALAVLHTKGNTAAQIRELCDDLLAFWDEADRIDDLRRSYNE